MHLFLSLSRLPYRQHLEHPQYFHPSSFSQKTLINLKMWQTLPKNCKYAQNLTNMPREQQLCSKCGKHANSVAINLKMWQTCPQYGNQAQKCGKYTNSVAINLKTWQACQQSGSQAHSVAMKIKLWQTCPQCGNEVQIVANTPTE